MELEPVAAKGRYQAVHVRTVAGSPHDMPWPCEVELLIEIDRPPVRTPRAY